MSVNRPLCVGPIRTHGGVTKDPCVHLVQGVGKLDSEMGVLRNYLTTSSVLVTALKDVAAMRAAPLTAAPKREAATSTSADIDWTQTTEGLR